MIGKLYKKSIFEISKILLFLLIISINLREPYFHSRELLFFSFVLISFPFGNYKKIFYTLLLLAIWAWSLIYNVIVPGSDAINGIWFQAIIISAYLFLMVFSNKNYYETIIKAFVVSAVIVSCVTITLWLICFFVPVVRDLLVTYFVLLQKTTNLTFINISTRKILGIPFFFVWYRTIPIVIPALGYCFLRRLRGEKTRKNGIQIILFSSALILSGTRADMMSVGLLMLFYFCFNLFNKKYFTTASFLLLITFFVGVYFMLAFLNDSGSQSTSVKHLHQISYFDTFESDYIRTLFFGWGYGSKFYTLGRNLFVDVTELSHWETIRRYGLLSTIFIFVFIWLKPLFIKMSIEKSLIKYYFAIMVIAFILVACTNPYLLDSLGFCVLLFFDAFFESDTIEQEKRLRK